MELLLFGIFFGIGGVRMYDKFKTKYDIKVEKKQEWKDLSK